jgi:hypothetical protein
VAATLGRHRYRTRGLALLLALDHQACRNQEDLRIAVRRDPLLRQFIASERWRLPIDDRALDGVELGALSAPDVKRYLAAGAEQ